MREEIEIGDTERIDETAESEENAEEVVIEIHETVETTDIAAAAQAGNGMFTYTQLYLTVSCYVILDSWYCLKSSQ